MSPPSQTTPGVLVNVAHVIGRVVLPAAVSSGPCRQFGMGAGTPSISPSSLSLQNQATEGGEAGARSAA